MLGKSAQSLKNPNRQWTGFHLLKRVKLLRAPTTNDNICAVRGIFWCRAITHHDWLRWKTTYDARRRASQQQDVQEGGCWDGSFDSWWQRGSWERAVKHIKPVTPFNGIIFCRTINLTKKRFWNVMVQSQPNQKKSIFHNDENSGDVGELFFSSCCPNKLYMTSKFHQFTQRSGI